MDTVGDSAENINNEIKRLEDRLQILKKQLRDRAALDEQVVNGDARNSRRESCRQNGYSSDVREEKAITPNGHALSLDAEEYRRYGRQLIMPEIGMPGQLRLKNSSVLIVGVGGLGCPAVTYLAGAGVGRIGLVDGDEVEVSNLHRQTIHNTQTVGMKKVDSAVEYLKRLNPKIQYTAHPFHLVPSTSLSLFEKYDLILDCTDHPSSRYLISDAAVLAGKPLVSASALKTEGQLLLLNNPPRTEEENGGHCYRCVFPKPPPAETVQSCGEGGILGPVVGTMGVLMATEAIKIILSQSSAPRGPSIDHLGDTKEEKPALLLYSAFSIPRFRSIRLAGKRKNCISCSDTATVTPETLTSGSLDYIAFCGISSPVTILDDEERISAKEYAKLQDYTPVDARRGEGAGGGGKQHVLIDVREKVQFDLCHLRGSVNIPFSSLTLTSSSSSSSFCAILDAKLPSELVPTLESTERDEALPIYVICRYGNDSQLAVRKFKTDLEQQQQGSSGHDAASPCDPDATGLTRRKIKMKIMGDIRGGLNAWRKEVDAGFPEY